MSISNVAIDSETQRSNPRNLMPHTTTVAELKAALAREEELLRDKSDLLQRQDLLTQEFEHRLCQ
jgi:hypothetical protein